MVSSLKPRSTLDSTIEEEKHDARSVEQPMPIALATLDLSKFPAKSNGGVSMSGSSRKSSRAPKKTGSKSSKTKSSSSSKGSSPQRVHAFLPTAPGSPKLQGSMAFAQKAQGLNESYDAWMDQGQQQLIRESSGKGRYGRLTAIEQVILANIDPSWLQQLSRQSVTISENLEEEEWTVDMDNFNSMDTDAERLDSSCDLPAFSTYGEDTESMQSTKIADFEPSSPPSDTLHDGCPMAQRVFHCGDTSMDKCISSSGRFSINPENVEEFKVPITVLPQVSKSLGSAMKGPDNRDSSQELRSNTYGNDSSLKSLPIPEDAQGMQEQFHPQSLGVYKSREWIHDAFAEDSPSVYTPLYSFPTRSSMPCAPAKEASKRFSINLNNMSCATSGSQFEPQSSDVCISYREAQPPAQRRRHSFGFAKKILGVTLGMASSAAMVVSGLMIARLASNDSHNCDDEDALEDCHDTLVEANQVSTHVDASVVDL